MEKTNRMRPVQHVVRNISMSLPPYRLSAHGESQYAAKIVQFWLCFLCNHSEYHSPTTSWSPVWSETEMHKHTQPESLTLIKNKTYNDLYHLPHIWVVFKWSSQYLTLQIMQSKQANYPFSPAGGTSSPQECPPSSGASGPSSSSPRPRTATPAGLNPLDKSVWCHTGTKPQTPLGPKQESCPTFLNERADPARCPNANVRDALLQQLHLLLYLWRHTEDSWVAAHHPRASSCRA